MSRLKKAIKVIGFAVTVALALLIFTRSLHIGGWKALSVQTGSMRPAINPGDLVLVKRVPITSLKAGDVITYINPRNLRQTITHRIVAIHGPQLTVKGDANKAPDPTVFAHMVIGKVEHNVSHLGYIADFVRKPLGLALLIYVPALAIIIDEIKRLAAYYRSQQPYLAAGYNPTSHKRTASRKLVNVAVLCILLVVCSFAAVKTVQAALVNHATLTGNTITANNICLNDKTNINVSSSGSNINVTNTTNQTNTTGDTNSNGGTATSGNASNTNCTDININITNSD
jgi:signal peptidase I